VGPGGRIFYYSLKEKIKFDYILLSEFIFLVFVGIIAQFSANYPNAIGIFYKHLLWIAVSLPFFFFAILISMKSVFNYSLIVYIFSIILLISVFFFGSSIHRWIYIGGFQFQPSEFGKIGLIILISRLFSDMKFRKMGSKEVLAPIVVSLLPIALVLLEPDFGTSILYIIIALGLLWATPISGLHFLIFISPILGMFASFHIISWVIFFLLLLLALYFSRIKFKDSLIIVFINFFVGASTPLIWNFLQPYQKARVFAFLNPYRDPTGVGWHIIQSKITIGSGGFIGKGFLHGSLKSLGFIPMKNTDFIFSVIAEEFGFVGSLLLIIGYLLFLYRILYISNRARGKFLRYLGYGIFFYFFSQFTINIGMAMGILPVVGIPLPFLTYGGSSLLVSFIFVGLLFNINISNYEYI